MRAFKKWLKAVGLHYGEVIGITLIHDTAHGIQILKALRKSEESNLLEKCVAIDDDWQTSSFKNGNMWPLVDRDLIKTYFDSPPRTKGIGLTECLQKEMI